MSSQANAYYVQVICSPMNYTERPTCSETGLDRIIDKSHITTLVGTQPFLLTNNYFFFIVCELMLWIDRRNQCVPESLFL